MAVQKLYPESPDEGLTDWSIFGGGATRYESIDEGTNTPDSSDYVARQAVGDEFFKKLYENGTVINNFKAYHELVRVHLSEMSLRADAGGIDLNLYAAKLPGVFQEVANWGVGSFTSWGDFLLAYWNLNETGGIREDSTSNNHDFTSVTATGTHVRYNQGRRGNGASFASGLKHYLTTTIADNTDFKLNSSKTIGGWVKRQTSSACPIFVLGSGNPATTACDIRLQNGGGIIDFTVYDDQEGPYQALKTVSSNFFFHSQWAYVACVFDINEKKIKISINGGAFVEETLPNVGINDNFNTILLGGHPTVNGIAGPHFEVTPEGYFSGVLDEWCIWDAALSLSDIQDVYNNNFGVTYPLPIFQKRHHTILYDTNGLEISRIGLSNVAASGNLLSINSTSPASYTFNFNQDGNQQEFWNNYDLTSPYIDMQIFTETPTGNEFFSTGFYEPTSRDTTSNWSNMINGGAETKDDGHEIWEEMVPTPTQFSALADLYDFNFNNVNISSEDVITRVRVHFCARNDYNGQVGIFYNQDNSATVYYDLWLLDQNGDAIANSAIQTTSWTDSEPHEFFLDFNVASITPDIVTSENFGVRARAYGVSDGTKYYSVYIDVINLDVHYRRTIDASPRIASAIIAMDLDVEGTAFDFASPSLYLHNSLTPSAHPLHISNAASETGGIPLYTEGAVQLSDNIDLVTVGHDDAITPTGMPLYTSGRVSDNGAIDLFLLNTTTPASRTLHTYGHISLDDNRTLFTGGVDSDSGAIDLVLYNTTTPGFTTLHTTAHDTESGDIPLHTWGKILDNDNRPLFIAGSFSDNANMNLTIDGFGENITNNHTFFMWSADNSGMRDVSTLFMKSDGSGYEDSNIPLFIKAPSESDITSNMPLYIKNSANTLAEETTLYIQNSNIGDSGDTTLFVSAPGTTDGALPIDSNIPLYIERDQVYNWNNATMFMMVASGNNDNTSLFIKNFPNPTGNTTLFMSPSTASDSGDTTLYTHGF